MRAVGFIYISFYVFIFVIFCILEHIHGPEILSATVIMCKRLEIMCKRKIVLPWAMQPADNLNTKDPAATLVLKIMRSLLQIVVSFLTEVWRI